MRRRVCLFLAGLVLMAGAGHANAAIYYTGSGFQSGVSISTDGGQTFFSSGSGGIGVNSTPTLDGLPIPFTYCLDIALDIYVPGTYSAVVSTTGEVYGQLFAAAGKIAFLMDTIGRNIAANDATAQIALQAAIWKQIYGASFVLNTDTNYNSLAIITAYNTDISNVGTAPVSYVQLISPYTGDIDSQSPGWVQAQVTLNPNAHHDDVTPAPEPASLILWGLGAVGLVCGGTFRRRTAV